MLSEEDWRELEQEDLLTPTADPVFGPKVGREYRNISRKARRALRRGVEDAALVEWVGLEAVLEGVEVLSMAIDNSRDTVREHFEAALKENGDSQDLDKFLLPADAALGALPLVQLSESGGFYLQQGQPVMVPNAPRDGIVRVALESGEFLGVGEILDDGRVAPRRLIVTGR